MSKMNIIRFGREPRGSFLNTKNYAYRSGISGERNSDGIYTDHNSGRI